MKRVREDLLGYRDGRMWLDDAPFTGVGYVEKNGKLVAETDYRDGLKSGVSRSWYFPGKPYKHSRLFLGARHGKHREWHLNGQLKEEGDYELSFLVRRKLWDEDGNLVEDYEIQESEPNYKQLDSFRKHYADLLARERPSLDLD